MSVTNEPAAEPAAPWHHGYLEGRLAASQPVAVIAPPDEYDNEQAAQFVSGFNLGVRDGWNDRLMDEMEAGL